MANEPGRIPAMSDVAKAAGVSLQTVSRVINDHPNVSVSTRLRVQAAMSELGYRPNSAARALASGRSNVIGVVVEPGSRYGPRSSLYGMTEAAEAAGHTISVIGMPHMEQAAVVQAIDMHLEQRVRGIVVVAPVVSTSEAIRDMNPGVPVVQIGGQRNPVLASVHVDQVAGARLATRFLLDAGHRTVWHVTGRLDAYDSQDRIEGWSVTLTEAGAEVPPTIAGDWTPRLGYEAGMMLARMPEVTAVFTSNDQTALGVLCALTERGRRVPQDVSVVGYDNVDDSAYYIPPLTTVGQDFQEVGRRAIAVLLTLLAGDAPHHEVLAPELIVRSSVASPVRVSR